MFDNPIFFILGLSIGLMVIGALALMISALFPQTDRWHPKTFDAGLALAQSGYQMCMAGIIVFLVWLLIVGGIFVIYALS